MPQGNQHIRQAESNEAFYRSFNLTTSPHLDWAVTALFYCALHYVDACLALRNLQPTNHGQRIWNIRLHLSQVYEWYRELREKSEEARYQCRAFTMGQVRQYELDYFVPIRRFCRLFLSLP